MVFCSALWSSELTAVIRVSYLMSGSKRGLEQRCVTSTSSALRRYTASRAQIQNCLQHVKRRVAPLVEVSLSGKSGEGPMISVGVFQGELARWIVGLFHDWIDHRRVHGTCSLHHQVGIGGDDVKRVDPWSARGTTLASTGDEYASTIWPIQLAVVDRVTPFTWNHQVLGKAKGQQPLT